MSRRTRLVALLVALMPFAEAAAASPSGPAPATRHVVDRFHTAWTVRNGLPATPLDYTQSRDGLLWIATEAGLYRFDGVHFEPYRAPAGQTLVTHGAPLSVLATADGGLWLNYQFGGASHIANEAITNYPAIGPLAQSFQAFAQGANGDLWAGAISGLVRFDGHAWKNVSEELGLPAGRVERVVVDANTVWVTTGKRTFRLDRGASRFESFELTGTLQAIDKNRGWNIDDSTVYLASRSPSGTWQRTDTGVHVEIDTATVARDGSLWVASREGVVHVERATRGASDADVVVHRFNEADGLSSNWVDQCLEDREGSIWTITSAGIDRLRPTAFTTIAMPSGMAKVQLLQSGDRLLVSTSRSNGSPLVDLDHDEARPVAFDRQSIRAMARGNDGRMFFNADGKFWTFDGKHTTPLADPDTRQPADYRAQAMAVDGSGTLWASVLGKAPTHLFRYADGRWTPFHDVSVDDDSRAVSMMVGAGGALWLGFDKNRISVVTPDTAPRSYGPDQGVDVGVVTAMTEHDDHYWIGGSDGLEVGREGHFEPILAADGSKLAGISGVYETEHGDVWLNMTTGIGLVSADEMRSALGSTPHRAHVRMFDYLDGVPASLTALSTQTIGRQSDGTLAFLRLGSVAAIDPEHIRRNTTPPVVFIDASRVDGRIERAAASTRLDRGARDLQIDYTASSVGLPERARFRYQLVGFDRAWQDAGTRRQAFYTQLPPGSYAFHVAAANEDGLWSKSEARWDFTIPPTFVQSIWFKMALVGLALLMLTSLYVIRTRQLTQRARTALLERLAERERIARDLHDTFFQGIQGLILKFNAGTRLLNEADPARPVFALALTESDRVMREGRELVLDLCGADQGRVDLVADLSRVGKELAHLAPARIEVSGIGQERPLQPVCATELVRIGREAIFNAFRHASARNIAVTVEFDQHALKLTVADDGVGIPADIAQSGSRTGHLGLSSMRLRADRLRARFDIQRGQVGTAISVSVPAELAYRASMSRRWPGRLLDRVARATRLTGERRAAE